METTLQEASALDSEAIDDIATKLSTVRPQKR